MPDKINGDHLWQGIIDSCNLPLCHACKQLFVDRAKSCIEKETVFASKHSRIREFMYEEKKISVKIKSLY